MKTAEPPQIATKRNSSGPSTSFSALYSKERHPRIAVQFIEQDKRAWPKQ